MTLSVGHASETIGRLFGIGLDIVVKLFERHTAIGLSGGIGVLHVEIGGQLSAVAHEVANILCSLFDVGRSQILIGRIVQCTVFQQIILEIGRVQLTHEGAIHIERGDAVLRWDEVL